MNRCDLLINKLIHPFIRVLGRNWSSFKLCGLIAVVCAVALCALLITKVGLSLWVLARIVLAVMLTFLGLAMATKLMTGIEKLTYYHHLVAVLVVVSILLRLSRLPILPYLDIDLKYKKNPLLFLLRILIAVLKDWGSMLPLPSE